MSEHEEQYGSGGDYPAALDGLHEAAATEISNRFRILREHFPYVWKKNQVVSDVEDVDGEVHEVALGESGSAAVADEPGRIELFVDEHKKEIAFTMLGATAIIIGAGARYRYRSRSKKSD